jgi:hypothetical protein
VEDWRERFDSILDEPFGEDERGRAIPREEQELRRELGVA